MSVALFGELVVRVTQSIQISKLCTLNFLKIEMRHSKVTSADVNKCCHMTECIIKYLFMRFIVRTTL